MQLWILFLCVLCVYGHPVKLDVDDGPVCGVEASSNPIHRNPWLVYLEYYNNHVLRNIRCAASLITPRHLVTAAHCVKKALYDRLVARLGEFDLYSNPDINDGVESDPVRRIDVGMVVQHHDYDDNSHDIAVLVLEEDAPYTDFIRPICLPTGTVSSNDIFFASGWGEYVDTHIYSHIKKNISLPYRSREDCQNAYRNILLPEGVVCAGGEEGFDTCRGDSGGPLTLVRSDVRTELWGVTSSGNVHCGTKGSPGIYTSVKEHLDWVLDVVRKTG